MHITDHREMRARIFSSVFQRPVIVYRESPLFEYFSTDGREDGIILDDGKLHPLGSSAIDSQFLEEAPENSCCISTSFMARKCTPCEEKEQQCFLHPLTDEVSLLKEETASLREAVLKSVQSAKRDSSEGSIGEKVRMDVCGAGFKHYYDPIVAGDVNIKEIWHRASDHIPEKAIYVEVSAMRNGVSSVFSETFILSDEAEIMEDYSHLIRAQEFIMKNFVDGNESSVLAGLEKYRNPGLYLTTPLFPYSHIQFPGESCVIHTLDTTVFDLWIVREKYSIRKKVVAVAGTRSAILL